MKQILNLILSIFFLNFLASCANRPYFVVENKTDKEIKLELVMDSLNLNQTIANSVRRKSYYYQNHDPKIVLDSISNNLSPQVLSNYIYDSLQISSFFSGESPVFSEFQISPIKLSEEELNSGKLNIDLHQTLLDYYHYDSALVKKVMNEKTITLNLPAHYMFSKECQSCGDCSCSAEEAFPSATEMRIVIEKNNTITLTRKNFKLIMRNKKFHGQTNSYILEIE